MTIIASGSLNPVFAVERELTSGRPSAFCVVIATVGSTPQTAGSLMSCNLAGQIEGTIGGGCLEAAVRRQALELLLEGGWRKISMNLDHELAVKDGMICGGNMTVAIMVIKPESLPQWQNTAALVGKRMNADLHLHELVSGLDDELTIKLVPDPALFIAGAGHVGAATAFFAAKTGFRVTIIDDRPDFLQTERFPPGIETRCGVIPDKLKELQLNEADYVVIATRGHRDDLEAIEAVADRNLKYLGLLGSRRKVLTLFRELESRGISPAFLKAIHTPIGLKIGAETPEEIAIAIVAQLIETRRKKPDSDS